MFPSISCTCMIMAMIYIPLCYIVGQPAEVPREERLLRSLEKSCEHFPKFFAVLVYMLCVRMQHTDITKMTNQIPDSLTLCTWS